MLLQLQRKQWTTPTNMTMTEPQKIYKNVKLYTDYNLDTYMGLSGRDSHENSGFIGRNMKRRMTNKDGSVSLESVLKRPDQDQVTERELKKKINSPYLQYRPCVSFDTVPVSCPSKDSLIEKQYPSYDFPGVQIPPELYTMDEWYDNESGYAANDNDGYFIHNDYVTGPTSKSEPTTHRSRSPTRITTFRQMQSKFKRTPGGKIVREDYPSRPTVDNDAMVINRAYDEWSPLWNKRRLQIDDRLMDRAKYFKHAELLFPDLRKDGKVDKVMSKADAEEYENMTTKEKRRWLIMNKVIGYPNVPKTLLCHISGRKHTWVGLDYTIMKLAQDTDHVVIVANLPSLKKSTPLAHKHLHHHHRHHHHANSHPKDQLSPSRSTDGTYSKTKYFSGKEEDNIGIENGGLGLTKAKSLDSDIKENGEDSASDSDYEEDPAWASGYDRITIEDKLNDILLYISVLLTKAPKSIKVTVEIVIGKSAKILNDMVNVYMPDLFVMSKKKMTSEIRWHSIHLTDKFLKHSPVPVCVVFAKPMYQFEVNLEKEFPRDAKLIEAPTKQPTKKSVDQLDEWIMKSIKTGSKIARPQQPTVMKSMVEIALSSDKKPKKSPTLLPHSSSPATLTHQLHSGSTIRSKSSHDLPMHHNIRSTTTSPLRQESQHPPLTQHSGSIPGNIGIPLSKTRTISSTRPVKNWNANKNNLRTTKSNSSDEIVHRTSSHGSTANNGGFLSSLFKKHW